MAKCEKVVKTIVTKTFVLELDILEARTIMNLLNKVAGDVHTTWRAQAASIERALKDAGVPGDSFEYGATVVATVPATE